MWKRIGLVIPAIALSQMGATDCGAITRDPGFDLWCGDSLCAWEVTAGKVERAPTWNEGDPGVSFVGGNVAIEQTTAVTSFDTTCIEFSMIANVSLDAHVVLNVDVGNDGTVDDTETVPTTDWKPIKFLLKIRPPYDGVRFQVVKTGGGEAVLAQLAATTSTECDSALPAIDPRPEGLGSPCETDGDCDSGICDDNKFADSFFGKTCMACRETTCGSGDVCGLGDPTGPTVPWHSECVAQGSKELGDSCQLGSECATGICSAGGACSTCDGATACGSGETCGPAYAFAFNLFVPFECSPNEHRRVTGEACVNDNDCASSSCAGTERKECPDGRVCDDNNDCPFIDTQHETCVPVGIQGGVCQ